MNMSIDRNRFVVVAAAVLSLAIAAVGAVPGPAPAAADADDVRLNEIQVIGSHNSYKVLPSQPELDLVRSVISSEADKMQYEHAPLPVQFSDQKVRQIELDVWVDSAGGRYSLPLLRDVLGLGPYQAEVMDQPGIKAFHVQDVDYGSTCPTLIMCLQQVKGWSDANPGHVPIAILLELKDDPLLVGAGFTFTEPEPWTAAAMDQLDAEIRSVFGEDEMITPDDIRGGHPTLRDAVTTDGWPTLGASRGQVMFLMDNGGDVRTDYLAGHPSLAGRVVFTNAVPGADDAAFLKRNDPNDALIPSLVADGFLVRTRADGDTLEARAGNTGPRDAALASGAQFVSTDYPVPGIAVGFTTDYVAEIPGGTVARCNPVNAPEGCVAADLDLVGRTVPPGPPVTRPEATTSSTSPSPSPSTSTPAGGATTTVPLPGSSVPPRTEPTAPGGTTAGGSSTTTSIADRGSVGAGGGSRPTPAARPARPRPAAASYTG